MPEQKLCQLPFDVSEDIQELLFKHTTKASFENNVFHFNKDDGLILDTYFASFSIGKWNSLCNLNSLTLNLEFEGEFIIKIRNIEPGHNIKDFQEFTINSKTDGENSSLNIENFGQLKGLFTVEMFCLSVSGKLKSAFWGTNDPIRNANTKLAFVITTFNRQEDVTAAVKRITNELPSDMSFHLYVIDNGSNLELQKNENVTLIPNANYGGAGGFSRGLLEAMNEGTFSHCLFMDDDASCNSESLIRSYRLLQMVSDPKTAIAGAMLFEDTPYIQHESGALFNGMCHPLKHRLDLRDLGALVENERQENIDYGGWWFFAFPISEVRELAFPFFVRGDDSNFSLQHDFNIITLNGIGSWQENFSYKSSPMTEYLDLRYHLVHRLIISKLDDSIFSILKIFWRFIKKDNKRYFYASAEAECKAFNDFMKGPKFFENNLDTAKIRKKIGVLGQQEKLSQMDKDITKDMFQYKYEGRFWYLLRYLTLNGHLIPLFMFPNDVVNVPKEHPPERGVFLAKSALYYHVPTGKGVYLKHSKYRFFKNILNAVGLSVKYVVMSSFIKRSYKVNYKNMTSIETWAERFKNS